MPSFKITVEDTSPIIYYSPGWRAGHSSDDGLANLYSQSSFTVTNVKDAYVSFVFNGTGVVISGARRKNHGLYQVKVDGDLQPLSNGSVPDPGTFKMPLFSVGNLVQGLHTVVLINLDGSYLDIDFITWDTTIGINTDDKLYVDTFQDTSPSFTYLPTEVDWAVPPQNPGSFVGGSGHATNKPGASFVYSFDGEKWDAVSLYGPVGPDGPQYVVHIDGGPTTTFTALKEFSIPQSLLYHASSLGPGTHNLTLTHQSDDPRQTFAIDYAAVYATTAPSRTTETGRSESGSSSGNEKTTTITVEGGAGKSTSQPIGLIVGLTVSVVILLIFSGVVFTLFWRLKRVQRKRNEPASSVDPFHGVIDAPSAESSHSGSSLTMPQTTSTSRQHGYGFYKCGLTFVNRFTAEQSSPTALSTPDRVAGPSTSQLPSPNLRPTPRSENPPEYTVNPFF